MAANILLAEDDRALSALILDFFHAAGLEVLSVSDGEQALAAVAEQSFDLLILDVMMPHFSGLEVCCQVREDSSVPILFITALSQEENALAGFRAGADDYITKPFAIEELLARIRAALRKRTTAPEETLLTAGPLAMNVDKHQVTVKDQPVELTKKEFDLLRHLLENKGHVLSRETLLDSVWGFDFVGETNSVDVYIRFLRSKLDEAFGVKLIHTVRGVGYVIRES